MSRSFDHAIYKAPGGDVVTPWHQDGAFSRLLPTRTRESHLHFWIPLQDASVENGCMHYIPGSHRMPLLEHRTFLRRSGKSGLEAAAVDGAAAVECPVPLGGLAIHTPLTLHFAGPNRTDRARKAWIIQFAPFGRVQIGFKRLVGRAPSPLHH